MTATQRDKVYNAVPGVSRWYIGGHSLGGAMASSYVAGKEDRLSGLILLGAYPVNDSPIPTLCIYGSEDLMLDKTKLTGVTNVLELTGGNHAQFGNYGTQQGDGGRHHLPRGTADEDRGGDARVPHGCRLRKYCAVA